MSVVNSADFLESYPEILFLLTYEPYAPLDEPLHSENISEEVSRFIAKLNLRDVDLLYIYGIGLGYHYNALKKWLHEQPERRLIFFEDDLSVFGALLQSPFARDLFLDPQVTLHFLSKGKTIDAHLEEIIATFPCDRIEVAAIDSYQKRKKRRFQQIRLTLLRKSAVAHAILTESLYAHKMLVNLLRNMKRWHHSFLAGGLNKKFQNIPAIICGAGPSLQESIPLLKDLEDRALIIAGGSTIAALSNQGIQPHFSIALDPNAEEFDRLKIASAFESPFIYATRLQPDVFNAISGEFGYLISETGGPCENYFERQMGIEGDPVGPDLGPEALSVTTIAIALAVEMGCNPILLSGIDLAYTGMQRYADGIMPSSSVQLNQLRQQTKAPERMLKRKDIHGHYVHTLVKWVMESDCIASYAKAHPQTRFINVSTGGIGFPDIPNCPLDEVMQNELDLSFDLRAYIHAEIQHLKLPPLKEKLRLEMKSVEESLIRLGVIADQLIEELERVQALGPSSTTPLPTGKMAILEIDFQEEKAFECLFPTLGPALDKLLTRAFLLSSHPTEEEKRSSYLKSKIAKWKQWKEMIDSELAVFQKYGNL